MSGTELDDCVRRSGRQCPGLPHDVVVSVLGDPYRVVVEASGWPQVEHAEKRARLRLEVRTGHSAA